MKKKLIALDLDGTLLSDSKHQKIPENVKSVLANMKKAGHIVCLFTGRPWRATKKIYDELKLDTLVINYNGAHIHHPKKYDFLPRVRTMPINDVMKVLDDKDLNLIANNVAVEGPGFIHIANKKKSYFTESFIKTDGSVDIECPIKYELMTDNPTGVLIEVKAEYKENIHNIRNYFRAKFGDLAAFSYWDTGDDNLPILEFTNFKARKDIALIRVARYYGISMEDTIAFGDGFNDAEMLKVAGVGVAMSNSSEIVKQYANVVSKYTNKEGGVAKFLKWYFAKGYKKVKATMYNIKDNKSTVDQIEQDE